MLTSRVRRVQGFFEKVQHHQETLNLQPNGMGGIVVMVTGKNDIFRLVYPAEDEKK